MEQEVKVKVEDPSFGIEDYSEEDVARGTSVKVEEMTEDVNVDAAGPVEVEQKDNKRRRKRKRQLYLDICKQMEFYFSDANITKNRLMLEMITASEFVPLANFKEFNRIKSLTSSVDDLKKACATSEHLLVSEDGTGVSRKVPYDPDKLKSEEEMEECTVYVENVPRHVDHAWLEKIFLSFGPIAYISLPKFRRSGQPKGFAFIEFERKESAKGCLEAYQGEGAVLPPDMDPGQLMSVQTFNEEQELNRKGGATPGSKSQHGKSPAAVHENTRKRKLVKDEEEKDPEGEELYKKPRESRSVRSVGSVSVTTPSASSDLGTDTNTTMTNPTSISNTAEPDNDHDGADKGVEGEGKTRGKRKKKNKTSKTAEEKLEGDSIHLKVMPKRTWRQLRNRYLNLQRQNMSRLKQQLREHNMRNQFYKNCHAAQSDDPRRQLGNIVELCLDSAAESVDAFKKQVQEDLSGMSAEEAEISQFVKYVDYEEAGLRAHVRFSDDECFADRILAFVQDAEKVFKSARILTVQESLEYKARVQEALKHKKKSQPRKKERGKDRLLRAATKASQHIRFDEGCPTSVKEFGILNSDDSGTEMEEPETTPTV